VAEYADRLDEVPMERGGFELVGKTVLYGQPIEMRKFDALLPTPQTEADWEEMPWLMAQGVGLVNDTRSAGDVIERMMSEAQTILGRLGRAVS
jgi:nitronate monooxygenase